MKKAFLLLLVLFLLPSARADQFRVHYSIHGSGRRIIVNAESSSDARRTVQEMIPDAVVTGAWRIRK